MNTLYFVFMVIEAVVILFELRALMQSSSVDYYHKVTQAVVRLTEPLIRVIPFRNKSIGGFYFTGVLVAFVIALFGCALVVFTFLPNIPASQGLWVTLYLGTICTIKSFGYMVLFLLLAQALTSWLPSTREWSYYFSQITNPLVSPIQKIIPPIGMIDISLMILMLVIFGLDRIFLMIFGQYWMVF
ncbi:YggT family protein [Succinivibrio sp.]|uniref:YggT family protein n=1 Tax=Succinivibrio sp. TaxID=2053619 RepID=UPI00386B711E